MTDISEDFLEHFGVKGMKWGVRKERTPGVSAKVDREARKDAQEFARAKAFYGQGAGTRRKLIKQTVDAKAKRIPGYKDAFDNHLERQDMSKHASKAITERKRTDRKEKNTKRASYLARRFTGEMGTQAAFTALVIAGVAFAKSDKGKQVMQRATNTLKSAQAEVIRRQGAKRINDILKNMS